MPNIKQETNSLSEIHSLNHQKKESEKVKGMVCKTYGLKKIKTAYSDEAHKAFKKSFTDLNYA